MDLKQQIPLSELLLNENYKVPNIEGNTQLILRAIDNSKLNTYSKEKEAQEKEVCLLVNQFSNFNQIHFTELVSYITVSKFNMLNILQTFSSFVREVGYNEDINLKGRILRFIQIFNKSLFSMDYIKKRFKTLKESDPWLFAELIIVVSWKDGVNFISDILKSNNDTSYLFPLILNWVSSGYENDNLNFAFNSWIRYFNSEDINLLKEYCKQFSLPKINTTKLENQLNITATPVYKQFKQKVQDERKRAYA